MKYISDLKKDELAKLLAHYGITLEYIAVDEDIPGSYWGAPEAGIIKNTLYVRSDTPVHSALHESCHFICMDDQRRQTLHTDTGGDYDEENAVCYLQIILAEQLSGMNRNQLCADMDEWGYTFRLGSAGAWFEKDAQEPLQWLINHNILTDDEIPTWQVRH